MASIDSNERSLSELLQQASQQTATLVRQEIRLGQLELQEKGKRVGIGAGMFGGAGVVALYGVGALIAAAIMLIATALAAWLAGVIVGVARGGRARAHGQEAGRGGDATCARAGCGERPARRRSREGEGEPMTQEQRRDDPEQLREDIRETREDLGDIVEALGEKADVKAQARAKAGAAQESAKARATEVGDRAKERPVPFAAGAVVALLLLLWLIRRD